MKTIREKAARARTLVDAAGVFEQTYGLSLEELHWLYQQPCWKHAALGGNRWGSISAAVRDLVAAMAIETDRRIEELLKSIPEMKHNTGTVEEKLRGLKGP